jgi:hypothetical protein
VLLLNNNRTVGLVVVAMWLVQTNSCREDKDKGRLGVGALLLGEQLLQLVVVVDRLVTHQLHTQPGRW